VDIVDIKAQNISKRKLFTLRAGNHYRVGIIVKMPETRMNTGLLKSQNDVWQRFGNI
jgi:hypothetical protein